MIYGKQFGTFVDQYKEQLIYNYDILIDDSWRQNKIWVFWNNPDSMPLMVQSCIDRIRQMSNGHEVVILTEGNLKDYIDFEPVVWRKYKEGKSHELIFLILFVLLCYIGMEAFILIRQYIQPVRWMINSSICHSFQTTQNALLTILR